MLIHSYVRLQKLKSAIIEKLVSYDNLTWKLLVLTNHR